MAMKMRLCFQPVKIVISPPRCLRHCLGHGMLINGTEGAICGPAAHAHGIQVPNTKREHDRRERVPEGVESDVRQIVPRQERRPPL